MRKPLFQVAVDVVSGEMALRLAKEVAAYADIIEAGTPLIKSVGVRVVKAFKELFPSKKILADMKIADTGALEASMAFDAGADMVTVLAAAPLATIKAATDEARRRGKEIIIDLIGLEKRMDRVSEVVPLRPDYLAVHAGIDEQGKGEGPFDFARKMSNFGIYLSVAGGLNRENISQLAGIPVGIVVVGQAITKASSPAASAHEMRALIEKVWEA